MELPLPVVGWQVGQALDYRRLQAVLDCAATLKGAQMVDRALALVVLLIVIVVGAGVSEQISRRDHPGTGHAARYGWPPG